MKDWEGQVRIEVGISGRGGEYGKAVMDIKEEDFKDIGNEVLEGKVLELYRRALELYREEVDESRKRTEEIRRRIESEV